MSALTTFFSAGGEVPIGGVVLVNKAMAGVIGNRFDQGNNTFFRQGYWEYAIQSDIRGYGSGAASALGTSPAYHNAYANVNGTIYMFHQSSSNTYYKTSDGITYTSGTLPSAITVVFAYYEPVTSKLFVQDSGGVMRVSGDQGATWSTTTGVVLPASNHYCRMMTYTGSKFLFIPNSSSTVYTSTDGIAWATSTPTGYAVNSDASYQGQICSNGSGRVVIAKFSNAKVTNIYTSTDHGVTFTKTSSSLIWGGSHSSTSVEYLPSADTYAYCSIFSTGAGPVYVALGVAVSVDGGTTFRTCVNPTGQIDQTTVYLGNNTAAPYVFGDPKTKNWSVYINGGAVYTPGKPVSSIPESTGVGLDTVLTQSNVANFSLTIGQIFRFSNDNIAAVGINGNYVMFGKSYKENNYMPCSLVGAYTGAVTDSSAGGHLYYVRVK